MTEQVVVLHLGLEEYALEISKVREIVVYKGTTKIPNTPDFMEGIINLRNQIIPVMDIGKKLGVKTKEQQERSAVIVEVAGQLVALIVDEVSDVLDLDEREIEAAPGQGTAQRAHLRGVGKKDNRLIILLTIEKLFDQIEVEALKKLS